MQVSMVDKCPLSPRSFFADRPSQIEQWSSSGRRHTIRNMPPDELCRDSVGRFFKDLHPSTVSRIRASSLDRLSNRKNHSCRTIHVLWSRKPRS